MKKPPFDLKRAVMLDKYHDLAIKTKNAKLKKKILLEMKKMKQEVERVDKTEAEI